MAVEKVARQFRFLLKSGAWELVTAYRKSSDDKFVYLFDAGDDVIAMVALDEIAMATITPIEEPKLARMAN